MYAGAAVSAVSLLTSLADTLAYLIGNQSRDPPGAPQPPRGRVVAPPGTGHAAQVYTFLVLVMALALIPIAVWLWMARGGQPGQELGAHRVRGPVRPGNAPAGRDHGSATSA